MKSIVAATVNMLTAEQVARMANQSPRTIQRAVQNGRLRGIKVASVLLFHPGDVKSYLLALPAFKEHAQRQQMIAAVAM